MPFVNPSHFWLLLILLVVVLIIWGPGKLPDVGSGLGRAIREFRKASNDTREEFARATRTDDPGAATPAAPLPSAAPAPVTPSAAAAPVSPSAPAAPVSPSAAAEPVTPSGPAVARVPPTPAATAGSVHGVPPETDRG